MCQPVTGLRGQGTHSVGQGQIVTAAPTPDSHSSSVSPAYGGRAPTVSANCDGCAYLRTVAHSLLAVPRGRTPTVLAPAYCNGCAYRPVHPNTHAASTPRSQWAGGSGRVMDWCRPAPRRLGHVRLERSIVSRSTRYRLGWLSRTASVSDPRFYDLLVNISCNA